jgi:hypothetical protein
MELGRAGDWFYGMSYTLCKDIFNCVVLILMSVMDFWCENVNKLHNPIETPPCCFEGRGKWLSASGVRLSLPLPPHNIGPMKGEGIK